jgi:hypothetical protein
MVSKRMTQLYTKCPQQGGQRLAQKLAATLCVLFLIAVPALADEVRIGQVVQTQTNSQSRPELKLSSAVSQDPVAPGTKGSTQQNGPANGQKPNDSGLSDVAAPGVAITNEGASIGVDIIEEGEVEGTICDCGEIFVAGSSFPKWPFLFLSAVPFIFINECDDCANESETPTPTPPPSSTPTPTPPSSEVPEPASLLLFGTGLAAAGGALRRRYAKARRNKQEEE